MTVLLGAAPSIIGPSEVGAWMAAKGAPGAAAVLDFAGQQYGFRSAAGVPRWGSVASDMIFSRASIGGRFPAASAYEMVASGAPRFDHDPVTRAPRGVLIEAAAGHISTQTANIPAWAGASGTNVNRTSYFSGGVAVEHFGPSSGYRSQDYTLVASTNYRLDVIIERGAAAPPHLLFGLYRGGWVGSAYYVWATDTMEAGPGTSSGYFIEPLGTGPNGGKLVRVSCVVNSGAGGLTGFFLYPTASFGSAAGQSAILHHACCTPGTLYHSPSIIGASAQTRAADSLSMPLPIVPANGFTLAFRARMPRVSNSGDSNLLFSILPASGIGNRIDIDTFSGVGTLWFNRPSAGVYRQLASGIALGAEFRGAVSWSASRGWRGTVNGGAILTNTDAAPSEALTRITIGSRAGAANWGSTIKLPVFWAHGDFSDEQMRGLLA